MDINKRLKERRKKIASIRTNLAVYEDRKKKAITKLKKLGFSALKKARSKLSELKGEEKSLVDEVIELFKKADEELKEYE